MALTKIDDRGLTTPIDLLDNEKIRFGTGNDLEIYHNGSNSKIHNDTGHLLIETDAASAIEINKGVSENLAKFIPDGAVELYYDGVKKLDTYSSGVIVHGELHVASHLVMEDNDIIKLGSSADLQIYHDGTKNYLKSAASTNTEIWTDTFYVKSVTGTGEAIIKGSVNGAVELYYDNVKRFETLNYGVRVTGQLVMDQDYIKLDDTVELRCGNGDDLKIYHDGSHSYIKDAGTGDLRILSSELNIQNAAGTETQAYFAEDGAVALYYDGSKKVETASDKVMFSAHAKIATSDTYDLGATGARWRDLFISNDIDILDNGKILLGASDDLQIYHDGSHSYISDTGTGYLIIKGSEVQIQSSTGEDMAKFVSDGGVELYHDNVKRFYTHASGAYCVGNLGASNELYLPNDGKLVCGGSDDLQIYHDSTDGENYISAGNDGRAGYVYRIINEGNNSDRLGIKIICGADDASGTNYAIVIADGNNTAQGYVTFSGGTVSYGAFTAHHPCTVPDSENPSDSSNAYPYGTLLETISIEYTQKDGANTERGIRYKVQKTQSANSRKVLGAYGSSMNGGPDGQTNEHQALVLGDGHILVNNAGGNIEIGDGICSSATAGIGQKATANPSMIIGIAQEAVTFTGSETKLVAVQYGLQQFIPWT